MIRLGALLIIAAGTLALATAPTAAGQMTAVPASPGGPAVPAYVASPAGPGAHPGLLILHGCEGYNRRYARIADGFAREGFVAVAIDTLSPRGVKNACSDPHGSRDEAAFARVTLAWMRTRPAIEADRLALVGYSMGAIAALDLADAPHAAAPPPGVRAVIAYYPACRNRQAAAVNVPLLILMGSADDWTPAGPCRALAADAARLGKPVSIVVYPGATHAFNVARPNRVAYGHQLRYDAAAASDAALRTLDDLHRYLGATVE